MQKRRTKRDNFRDTTNLCPSCFSKLNTDSTGQTICSGDRLESLSEQEKLNYECSSNLGIGTVFPDANVRVPDFLAVKRLERLLKRQLTESELTEGHVFLVDNKKMQLPFVNFPDDM